MTHPKMQTPVFVSDTSPGPNYAVTRAETKTHLRVDGTDDDGYIDTLIAAAQGHLNGWNGALGGVVLITQTWRADFNKFPGARRLDLPLSPVQSVTVNYFDDDNVSQTQAASKYALHEDSHGPYLWLDENETSWPSTYDRRDAVQISTVCGYGDNPSDVPEAIRIAMFHIIAGWYRHREPVAIGQAPHALPYAAEALLHNVHRHRF